MFPFFSMWCLSVFFILFIFWLLLRSESNVWTLVCIQMCLRECVSGGGGCGVLRFGGQCGNDDVILVIGNFYAKLKTKKVITTNWLVNQPKNRIIEFDCLALNGFSVFCIFFVCFFLQIVVCLFFITSFQLTSDTGRSFYVLQLTCSTVPSRWMLQKRTQQLTLVHQLGILYLSHGSSLYEFQFRVFFSFRFVFVCMWWCWWKLFYYY